VSIACLPGRPYVETYQKQENHDKSPYFWCNHHRKSRRKCQSPEIYMCMFDSSVTVAQIFVTPGETCSKMAKSSWVVLSCIFLPISLSTLGPGLHGARSVYGRSTDIENGRSVALTCGLCNPSRRPHAFAFPRLAAQHGQERGFQLQSCERLEQLRSSSLCLETSQYRLGRCHSCKLQVYCS